MKYRNCKRCRHRFPRMPYVTLCDSCRRILAYESDRRYVEKHRVEINERHRLYRLNHLDDVRKWSREWHRNRRKMAKNIRESIYEDVLKHPRKWLRNAVKQ